MRIGRTGPVSSSDSVETSARPVSVTAAQLFPAQNDAALNAGVSSARADMMDSRRKS